MDQVCRDRAPIFLTQNRDQSVVMMSLDERRMVYKPAGGDLLIAPLRCHY